MDETRQPTPDDDLDGPHSFVEPVDPAEREAAKRAYDDEMHRLIIERLSKTPPNTRRRWRKG